MTNKEIGEKLRNLRNKAGFTLQYVADINRCGKGHICEIESGKRTASLYKINELLKIYNSDYQALIKIVKNK